jgi:hypothetical protein
MKVWLDDVRAQMSFSKKCWQLAEGEFSTSTRCSPSYFFAASCCSDNEATSYTASLMWDSPCSRSGYSEDTTASSESHCYEDES